MTKPYDFYVTSAVGRSAGPMVTITVNGADFTVNTSPADARSLAVNLLEAAAAAENDAFFVSWLQDAEMPDEDIAQALLAFRKWKQEHETIHEP